MKSMKKLLVIDTPKGKATINLSTLDHQCSEDVMIDYAVDVTIDNNSYRYDAIVEPDGRLHSDSYERHFEYLHDCMNAIKRVKDDCRKKGIKTVKFTIEPFVYVYNEQDDEYCVVEHNIKLVVKNNELHVVYTDYTQWATWSKNVTASQKKA